MAALIKTTREVWNLDIDEIGNLQEITVGIAKEVLNEEQTLHNFDRNPNVFVDGSQFKKEEQVKFGGKISYQERHSLKEVMSFIDAQIQALMPKLTGGLLLSHSWMLNGKLVTGKVNTFNKGDQLIAFAGSDYAKYIEVGSRGLKGRRMYRLAASRAKRVFGKAFIIEHVMIQTKDIPKSYSTKATKSGRKAYSKEYYAKRWAATHPGIKLLVRQGVGTT